MARALLLCALLLVTIVDAASTTRVVAPDLAGMIYPSSSVSRHVHFGYPRESLPTAYELVAPTASVVCVDGRLCLELHISSVFELDPFFLHRYDAKTPLVSATFDTYEASDILPLIPGSSDGSSTVWRFQSNVTDALTIDLLLRLRQRSQRLSARDQLLVQMRFELVDSNTLTSTIRAYSVYGSQQVTHKTRRADANTVRVALSIAKNAGKKDVSASDVYPLAMIALSGATDASATSCVACGDFLDACQEIESCQSVVLPCLVSQLEAMAAGSSGSPSSSGGDNGSGGSSEAQRVDFLGPLAACTAALPTTAWAPIRQTIFCFARLNCPLGRVPGDQPGEQHATILQMTTTGSQKFSVAPTESGTNNVDLTIIAHDIQSSANGQTFAYKASASYLGIYLRSFVLQQAAEVSVLVNSDDNKPSALLISLNYANALMLKSLTFRTAAGEVPMLENVPTQAVIEYPATSARPALDVFLGELQERVIDSSDAGHSWKLAADCLSCSEKLFGCSSGAVSTTGTLCSYHSMASSFGKCIRQQIPPNVYRSITQGIISTRPVANEISRCLVAATNGLDPILKASSSLACFAATQCPFGPISLVSDTRAIILETTSYIQVLRISPGSSTETVSFKIEYKTGEFLIATTEAIAITSTENVIKKMVSDALVLTGVEVLVSSSGGNTATSEWTVEIIYRHVFFAGNFSANAVVIGSGAMRQVLMEGGDAELRIASRDPTKVFTLLETLPQNDKCRLCAGEIQRCLGNTKCQGYSHDVLLPWLREAAQSNQKLEIDLTPLLTTPSADAFSSQEAWRIFSADLSCLALTQCQTGYDSVSASTLNLDPMAVKIRVSTYADTQWNVSIDGDTLSYIPPADVMTSIDDAALALKSWIESLDDKKSWDLEVMTEDYDVFEGVVIFDVKFFGGYDAFSGQYTQLAPRLFPTFTVAGGTAGTNPDVPSAEVTLWKLSLSSEQKPQLDKLLDLLEFGIAGATTPVPASTVASPGKLTAPEDKCTHCAAILAKCQANEECTSFSEDALIPLLKNTPLDLQIRLFDDYGAATFTADLYPTLLSLASNEKNTPSAWDLVTAELLCLAYDNNACDMEYDDVQDKFTDSHWRMDLSMVRSWVEVAMLTYYDTEWDIAVNGSVFSFVPTGYVIETTAPQLVNWFEALNSDPSMPLEVYVVEPGYDEFTDESVTLSIRFSGSFDDELCQYMMVNPALIPSFLIVEGTTENSEGFSPAEANVTLPSLTISSKAMKPQYSRLLDMLSDGIGSTAVTTSASPSKVMTTDDLCRDCELAIDRCRNNADCLASSQNTLAPLLRSATMAMSKSLTGQPGDALVSLNLSSVLFSLASMEEDAFLTRDGWDAFANELACFAGDSDNYCDLEYDDVISPFWGFHVPTKLNINMISIWINFRTYPTTDWEMTLGGITSVYTHPSDVGHTTFRDWVQAELEKSQTLAVVAPDPIVDGGTHCLTMFMGVSGSPGTYMDGGLLAPPWLIPHFKVTGGELGGGTKPAAEAEVRLWDVEITNTNQRPQYSKLVDMLEFGLK